MLSPELTSINLRTCTWAVCSGDITVAALPIARSWVWRCSTIERGNSLAEKLFELADVTIFPGEGHLAD